MVERTNIHKEGQAVIYGSWNIVPNVFEAVRSYLLWGGYKQYMPFTINLFNCDKLPNLDMWMCALGKPNAPIVQHFPQGEQAFIEYIATVDLAKDFDDEEVDRFVLWKRPQTKAIEVDAVATSEAENDHAQE